MSKVKIQGDPNGTGALTIAAPNTNTDRTLTLPDQTGTLLTTATAGVPVGGPAFSVYCSTATAIANGTMTKVPLNTEIFDTNNNFDAASNYRFTPTVAGYYQVCGGIYYSFGSGSVQTSIFRNGSVS